MVSENAVYFWTDVKGDKISFLKISGYLWTGPESGINAVQVEDIHFVIVLSPSHTPPPPPPTPR